MAQRVDSRASVWSNELVGRILALDYGTKNVGIARSDELRLTAHPLPSIPNLGWSDLVRRLKTAIREHGIERIVIGIPINMDGTVGEAALKVQQFVKVLQSEVPLPLETVDERLSTLEAREKWNAFNPRAQRKYRTVDSVAAALILERYLNEPQSLP
jgi:putative Holliday junction resolvase